MKQYKKTNMKEITVFVTTLFVVVAFCACESNDIPDTPDIPPIDTTKTVVQLDVMDLSEYKTCIGEIIKFSENSTEFQKHLYRLNIMNDQQADSIDFWQVYAPMDSIFKANPDNVSVDWNDKKSIPNNKNTYDVYIGDSIYYNVIPHDLWLKSGKIPMTGYYALNKEDSVAYRKDGMTLNIRPDVRIESKDPEVPGEYPINSAMDIPAYWNALQSDILNGKSVNITFGGLITIMNTDVASKLLWILESGNDNDKVKILGNVQINSGVESVKVSPNIVSALVQTNGKIMPSGDNLLNIQIIKNEDELISVLAHGAKVGINKAINFEYPHDVARPDTLQFTGSNEIDLSAGLANLPKRNGTQYIMIPGQTPVAVENAANLMRISQPCAQINGADIRATQDPIYSRITTDKWNIGTGDYISDRVQISTRINTTYEGNDFYGNEKADGQIVIGSGSNIPTVSYNQTNWRVISMRALPINNLLRRRQDNGYARWNLPTDGILLVVENPAVWGEIQKLVFQEVYGTESHDITKDFNEPFIRAIDDLRSHQMLDHFLEILGITAKYNPNAQYNIWDGWMKQYMWTTRNGIWGYPGFAQQFPGERAYGE